MANTMTKELHYKVDKKGTCVITGHADKIYNIRICTDYFDKLTDIGVKINNFYISCGAQKIDKDTYKLQIFQNKDNAWPVGFLLFSRLTVILKADGVNNAFLKKITVMSTPMYYTDKKDWNTEFVKKEVINTSGYSISRDKNSILYIIN